MDADLQRLIDRQEIADLCVRYTFALDTKDWPLKQLGNVVAEVDGDTARATSYFQAQHVRAGTPGGDTYIIAGSYTDTLTRTPDGWKIAERVQVYLWRDGNRAVVSR